MPGESAGRPHAGAQRTAVFELSEDERLVILARQGSAAAFREIMQRNNRRLYRTIRSILKDSAETEEAMQESYLHAFANLEAFGGEESLPSWLARIALHQALMRAPPAGLLGMINGDRRRQIVEGSLPLKQRRRAPHGAR